MLSIEYKSTGELVPYVNNSRTHSEQQVQQVAASIKEFGFTNPILIDHDGGIIAGHGRLQAAQLLSLDEVPTITLEGLTEAQRKAYVIADNKLALNAGWNDELLKVEIEALTESDFNLDILGWDVLPEFDNDLNYDILDDEDVEDQLEDMNNGVKKAIQIEFDLNDYQEAQEVIKFWRTQGAYVGGIIIDLLKKEKANL
jgi:ParB-like chromosome segregation protein Spo0J